MWPNGITIHMTDISPQLICHFNKVIDKATPYATDNQPTNNCLISSVRVSFDADLSAVSNEVFGLLLCL